MKKLFSNFNIIGMITIISIAASTVAFKPAAGTYAFFYDDDGAAGDNPPSWHHTAPPAYLGLKCDSNPNFICSGNFPYFPQNESNGVNDNPTPTMVYYGNYK